ncbi:MAG: YeeE/YedE family protein [Deferribacteraceae bacterium]|jgi:hypothetical protein|nr:YeeE/YedE family protein [Deferribacteraceae bacterium]
MRLAMEFLHRKKWSGFAAGSLTGIAAAVSCLAAAKIMGASGGFESCASMLVSLFNLDISRTVYFIRVKPPVADYQTVQFIGMIAGAFASAKLSGDFKLRWLPDNEWIPSFGTGRLKRLAALFLGCALLQIGASIAGGCTSGLGISGMFLLSPAGLLFIAGVFSGGIFTALCIYRKRY